MICLPAHAAVTDITSQKSRQVHAHVSGGAPAHTKSKLQIRAPAHATPPFTLEPCNTYAQQDGTKLPRAAPSPYTCSTAQPGIGYRHERDGSLRVLEPAHHDASGFALFISRSPRAACASPAATLTPPNDYASYIRPCPGTSRHKRACAHHTVRQSPLDTTSCGLGGHGARRVDAGRLCHKLLGREGVEIKASHKLRGRLRATHTSNKARQ